VIPFPDRRLESRDGPVEKAERLGGLLNFYHRRAAWDQGQLIPPFLAAPPEHSSLCVRSASIRTSANRLNDLCFAREARWSYSAAPARPILDADEFFYPTGWFLSKSAWDDLAGFWSVHTAGLCPGVDLIRGPRRTWFSQTFGQKPTMSPILLWKPSQGWICPTVCPSWLYGRRAQCAATPNPWQPLLPSYSQPRVALLAGDAPPGCE